MQKLKDTLPNMAGVLMGVSVVVGGVLAYVNNITTGPKEEKAKIALAQGIKDVMQVSDLTVAADDTVKQNIGGKELTFVVHKANDKSGKELGVAVESTTSGFGGDLKVLVGFNPDGQILGYTVLTSAETPGLGAKAQDWFQKGAKGDIIGKSPKDKPLTVNKDGGEIDAITASTITTRAFLAAVNQAYGAYANQAVDGNTGATKQNSDQTASNQTTIQSNIQTTE